MEKLQGAILLEKGENILGYYKTKHTDWSFSKKQGFHGYLVLTSHRILLYKEKGVINKLYKLNQTFNLSNIVDINLGGWIDKYVSINGVKVFLDGVDNKSLAEIIRQATRAAKARQSTQGPLSHQQIQQIVNIKVPSNSTTPIPEKSELSKASIYCTYCGHQNDVDAKYCKNCGASID